MLDIDAGTLGGTAPLVIAWDLDETLLIFNSLVNRSYAQHINAAYAQQQASGTRSTCGLLSCAQLSPVDEQAARGLGERIADSIFGFLDQHWQYETVERLDPMHVSDMLAASSSSPVQGLCSSPSHSSPGYRPAASPPAPGKVHAASLSPAIAPSDPTLSTLTAAAAAGPGPPACSPSATPLSPTGRSSLKRSVPDAPTTNGQVGWRDPSNTSLPAGSGPVQAAAAGAPPPAGAVQQGPQAAGAGAAGSNEAGCAPDQAALKRARSSDTPSGTSLAQIFMRILRMYSAGLSSMPLSAEERSSLHQLRQAVDSMTGGWVASAASLLHGISAAGALQGYTVHHCIVTTGQLVATLGKLLLFELSDHFPADHVYSASKQTKLVAFKKLRARWGVRAHYLAVGDSREEERAAATMRWPFIKISLAPNFSWPPGLPASHPSLAALPINAALARSIRSHTLNSDPAAAAAAEAATGDSPRSLTEQQHDTAAPTTAGGAQGLQGAQVPAQPAAPGNPALLAPPNGWGPSMPRAASISVGMMAARQGQAAAFSMPQLPSPAAMDDASPGSLNGQRAGEEQGATAWPCDRDASTTLSHSCGRRGLLSSLSSDNTADAAALQAAMAGVHATSSTSAGGQLPTHALPVAMPPRRMTTSNSGTSAAQAFAHMPPDSGDLHSHPLSTTASLSSQRWPSGELASTLPSPPASVAMQRSSTFGGTGPPAGVPTSPYRPLQVAMPGVPEGPAPGGDGNAAAGAGPGVACVSGTSMGGDEPGANPAAAAAAAAGCESQPPSGPLQGAPSIIMADTSTVSGVPSVTMLDASGVDGDDDATETTSSPKPPGTANVSNGAGCGASTLLPPTALGNGQLQRGQCDAAALVLSSSNASVKGVAGPIAAAAAWAGMLAPAPGGAAAAAGQQQACSGGACAAPAGASGPPAASAVAGAAGPPELLEVPLSGVTIHQLWPQVVLDTALRGRPAELPG